MTHLARILKTKAWADLGSGLSLKSSPELVYDVCAPKGGGTSFWEVNYEGPESLARLAAAMATSVKDIGAQRIGIVSIIDVQKIGIQIQSSKGAEVYDKDFCNNFHRDLKISTLKQAFRITEKVGRNIVTLPISDVKRYFKDAINAKRFTIEELNPEFQKKLAKDGHFSLSF